MAPPAAIFRNCPADATTHLSRSSPRCPLRGRHGGPRSGQARDRILGSETAEAWRDRLDAFRDGLRQGGFIEGDNVAITYRWADGHPDRLLPLAAELVKQPVSVIVVLGSTLSAIAARDSTKTIPIVFRIGADPVQAGLVASLGRPGGNATGVTTLGTTLAKKQIELLHEVIPQARRFGLMVNPRNKIITEIESRDVPEAARKLGLDVSIVKAGTDAEIAEAFTQLRKEQVHGLVIAVDTFLNARSARLAELAQSSRIPAAAAYEEFVAAGGLISYGGSIAEASRRAGLCTSRVLKGENPSDIPVEQATALRLVVNRKAAAALGLSLPPAILARADDVID